MTTKTAAVDLQTRWQRRFDAEGSQLSTVSSYCQLSTAMLALGMPLQALEVADEGCQRWPDDLEVAQICGMALARSRATRAAAAQLTDVVARLKQQAAPSIRLLEEAIGALARTEKDFALQASSLESRRRHLERSVELYEDAYRSTGGYWTGINVATLLTLLGRQDQATAVARRVEQECRVLVHAPGRDADQY